MSSKSMQSDSTDEDISFEDIVGKTRKITSYFVSKWRQICLITFVGALLGLVYSFIKKPVYTAEYSFATENSKQSGGLSSYASLASQFGFDLGGAGSGVFTEDNLPELMRSRFIIEKVLLSTVTINNKQETLADLYMDFNNLRNKLDPPLNTIHFLPGADRAKFSLQQDSLLGVFHKDIVEKGLTVDKKDRKLTIIDVVVSSKNELFSKYFAEKLVKEVSDFYVQTQTKKTAESVRVLQHQTDSVRAALNHAIAGVASSIDVNPNPNPALQVLKVPSQHRQVDVQANTAILTELVKNLEISKITLRKETPLIQAIDMPTLPLEKKYVKKPVGIAIGAIIGFFMSFVILAISKILKMIKKIS